MRRRLGFAGAALVALVALTGCGDTRLSHPVATDSPHSGTAPSPLRTPRAPLSDTTSPGPTHAPTTTGASSATAGPPSASGAPIVAVTKVLVFMVENHSLDQMRSQMPWSFRLAQRYAYADHYRALTHPSLPNYLAITGGSTFGVHDDAAPDSHPLAGGSVFGLALAHGRTAGVYAESMPGTCAQTPAGSYAVKHNPWAYFASERADCRRFDRPLTALAGDVRAGTLPEVGLVVPNMCDIGHDCPLAITDAWLRRQVSAVMAGQDWRVGRLAIVVTADEDDSRGDNTVLTVVANPRLHHQVLTAPLTHLSLSAWLAQLAGGEPLRDAAGTPSLGEALHLL